VRQNECDQVLLRVRLLVRTCDRLTEPITSHAKGHFHAERNHQGKDNVLLFPTKDKTRGRRRSVHCRERLGGLLKYYCRAA
jgi:hypothetical protein